MILYQLLKLFNVKWVQTAWLLTMN